MVDYKFTQFARVRQLGTNVNCSNMFHSQHKGSEFDHSFSQYNAQRKFYANGYPTKEDKKCVRTKSARVKKLKTSYYSEMELKFPRMQTMDRRISSSSDKIDSLKKPHPGMKPQRTHSSSRLTYERKTQGDDESEDVNFVNSKVTRKSDFLSHSFNKSIPRTLPLNKTPFALFLEDDGPYSRKLFGPLANREEEGEARGRQKEREIYSDKCAQDNVKDFGGTKEIKKGTLWKHRDKLFSR